MITKDREVALVTYYADCVPIFLLDLKPLQQVCPCWLERYCKQDRAKDSFKNDERIWFFTGKYIGGYRALH